MIGHFGLATALALTIAGAAYAEGCAPEGGEAIGEIEAMNAMVLANDFAGYAAAINGYIGVDVAASIDQVAQVFTDGFDGCSTIVQRVDTGGMVQSVVVYHGKVGPLFGYWQSYSKDGDFAMLTFNLNTDLNAVMASLH